VQFVADTTVEPNKTIVANDIANSYRETDKKVYLAMAQILCNHCGNVSFFSVAPMGL
jgi:hypothetical protein